MNRRSFIGGVAACLGACMAPQVLMDRRLWKAPRGKLIAVINPAWVTAPYEFGFYVNAEIGTRVWPPHMGETRRPVKFRKGHPPNKVHTLPWAPRLDEFGKSVPPFIFQEIV